MLSKAPGHGDEEGQNAKEKKRREITIYNKSSKCKKVKCDNAGINVLI